MIRRFLREHGWFFCCCIAFAVAMSCWVQWVVTQHKNRVAAKAPVEFVLKKQIDMFEGHEMIWVGVARRGGYCHSPSCKKCQQQKLEAGDRSD